MNRSDILDTAKGYVTRDRAATHGNAEDQFTKIGQLWGVMLGVEVTPAKVSLMMAGLKLVRAWDNPQHLDSWADGCGYFACGGEIATRPAPVNNLPDEGISFADHIARRQAGLDALIREAEAAGLYDVGKPQSAEVNWGNAVGREFGAAIVRRPCTCTVGGFCMCPAAPRSAPENGINAPEGGGVAENTTGTLQARKTGGEA